MSEGSNELQLAPDDLRSTASELHSLSSDTDQVQQRLDSSWSRLEGGWEWYAEEDIAGYFQRALRELSLMAAMLEQMGQALVKTADLIEAADQAAVAFFELDVASGATGGKGSPGLKSPVQPGSFIAAANVPTLWDGFAQWLRDVERVRNFAAGRGMKTDAEVAAMTMYISVGDTNLRLRPTTDSPPITMLSQYTPVTLVDGTQVPDNNLTNHHIWYQVDTPFGRGWIAVERLSMTLPEQPSTTLSGGGFIMGVLIAGGNTWDPIIHRGADFASTGDRDFYTPYRGTIIASDPCVACTNVDPNEGRAPGHKDDPAFNYGYGAMAVIEYPYSDLSQEQLDVLRAKNIKMEPGQSLYLMGAHFLPTSIPTAGAKFTPGQKMAVMGSSGNAYGDFHVHAEIAINQSGLRPDQGKSTHDFWGQVVTKVNGEDVRFDPTSLFCVDQ